MKSKHKPDTVAIIWSSSTTSGDMQKILEDSRWSYILTGNIAFPNPGTYVSYVESEDQKWLVELINDPKAHGNFVFAANKASTRRFIHQSSYGNKYEEDRINGVIESKPKKRKAEEEPIPGPVLKRQETEPEPDEEEESSISS